MALKGTNFTGKKGGKKVRRKGKGLTRKQRKAKVGNHKNKYEHFASESKLYDRKDKTFRMLPLPHDPGQVVSKGTRMIYHGRLYKLMKDTVIPEKPPAYGKFKLLHSIE